VGDTGGKPPHRLHLFFLPPLALLLLAEGGVAKCQNPADYFSPIEAGGDFTFHRDQTPGTGTRLGSFRQQFRNGIGSGNSLEIQ
jgi:hypothetical protein